MGLAPLLGGHGWRGSSVYVQGPPHSRHQREIQSFYPMTLFRLVSMKHTPSCVPLSRSPADVRFAESPSIGGPGLLGTLPGKKGQAGKGGQTAAHSSQSSQADGLNQLE